ncbi:phosphatidylinositol glycan anchor biosynthesis class U protein [Hetaerina americana]|uniref:phosphatidylinositol glycan anchor biosynthesis class U protein n=1 Tax=Hetaerina americana TaxID=62018 RepID=UPI003A7F4E5B
MGTLLLTLHAVAGIARYWLINSEYQQTVAGRVEVSTPLNSWKRVTEGAYLYHEGIDPYSGDMFHETPVGLVIFDWLIRNCSRWLGLIFVASDLLTAHLLYMTARYFMVELAETENRERSNYAKDVGNILLKEKDLREAPLHVAAAYLLNPYALLSCASLTTTVFSNLCLASSLLSMVSGRRILSGFFLAFATYQSLYPVVLLVPSCMYAARSFGNSSKVKGKVGVCITLGVFLISISSLLYISAWISSGWHFLNSVYGFILTVPDLRPNVGLFWYFFTEMFEHFRSLFLAAFQLNALALYVGPLGMRLRSAPLLLAEALIALAAVFRSYPSLGDISLPLALLPTWRHLFAYMQQGFIVGCFLLITSVLGPTVWHLWIYSRSANANFYFGVTLVFAAAQIFLITDLLFAYIKREFSLHNGLKQEIDGKAAKLVLE